MISLASPFPFWSARRRTVTACALDRTGYSGEFQHLQRKSVMRKMHPYLYDAILFHVSHNTIEQANEMAVQIAVAMYWP